MAAVVRHSESRRENGAIAVEVALTIVLFLMFALGTIEVARIMFLWNTLSGVTQRAASVVATSAPAADHAGTLDPVAFNGVPLSDPRIDGTFLKVDYLNLNRVAIATPVSAAANIRNCMANPLDEVSCARYVRVQLCQPGGDACDPVPFRPLFPLAGMIGLDSGIVFPTFEAVAAAGALGYQ
ncbi:MAG TPA: TadE family protein [Ramlibacter sp.]|nr:TadE family protein [Ramlibacter sp.]